MYNFTQLAKISVRGFSEMLPALQQALGNQHASAILREVYGPRPWLLLTALAVLSALVGTIFLALGPALPYKSHIHWPAVVMGATQALLLRRYLFSPSSMNRREEVFSLLAASLIPVLLALLPASLLFDAWIATTTTPDGSPATTATLWPGQLALFITRELGVAAAYTIAVASLCYSRQWVGALWDLALRMIIFKVMLWVTQLVMIEIGIIGHLLSALLGSIISFTIPEAWKILADQFSYAGLLCCAYLAIIGGLWTVCARSYPELLTNGKADILKQLNDLLHKPKPVVTSPK